MQRDAGFTLVELIVTMTLVAILLVFVVPSFSALWRENRLATQANLFLSSLRLARSEALMRGMRVTLCKSADGRQCTLDGGYEQGWLVYVDQHNTAQVEDQASIIAVVPGMPGPSFHLTGNRPVARYVSYLADGRTSQHSGAFQAGTLTLCDSPGARLIIINSAGRARVSKGTC